MVMNLSWKEESFDWFIHISILKLNTRYQPKEDIWIVQEIDIKLVNIPDLV